MWYVYILFCAGGSFYTGATNNLEKRIHDHKNGHGGAYTRSHKPVRILYSEKHPNQSAALKREIQIKRWTRDKKIRELNLKL